MQSIAVKAANRSESGKKAAKEVRKEGAIPAIVYGGSNAVSISVELNEVRHAIYTPEFKLVDLELDGENITCIVKEVQFHPVTEKIVHIDFLRLVEGNPIKIDVPVRFIGSSLGLRSGGSLVPKVRRLSIKTTPDLLLDEISLDISHLELGQSVRVKDCVVPEGVEILNPANNPVASIEIPRALRSSLDDEIEGEGEEEGGEEGGEEAAESEEG